MTFDSDVVLTEVGKRFNLLRRLLGKSLEALAADLQSSAQNLKAIENGKMQDVLSGIEHLDETYGVDFNWLITGQGQVFCRLGSKMERDIYDLVVLLPWIDEKDDVYTVQWFVEQLEDPVKKKNLLALLPQLEKSAKSTMKSSVLWPAVVAS